MRVWRGGPPDSNLINTCMKFQSYLQEGIIDTVKGGAEALSFVGKVVDRLTSEESEKIKMKFRNWLDEEQKYKSAGTSINVSKLPATFGKLDRLDVVKKGMVIADLGGGKFDNAIEWAAKKDAKLYVIDKFNRSADYNAKNIKEVKKTGADIVTVNNVLNVIFEKDTREEVLKEAYSYLKKGGTLYILIYEGDGSGEGKETQKGHSWQNNKKTAEYVPEVKKIFPSASVQSGMIVATK